jgi:hypothetical protein
MASGPWSIRCLIEAWRLKVMRADTLLAGDHEVRSLKPQMQFDLAVLKNGADLHREFALARAAATQPGTDARRSN